MWQVVVNVDLGHFSTLVRAGGGLSKEKEGKTAFYQKKDKQKGNFSFKTNQVNTMRERERCMEEFFITHSLTWFLFYLIILKSMCRMFIYSLAWHAIELDKDYRFFIKKSWKDKDKELNQIFWTMQTYHTFLSHYLMKFSQAGCQCHWMIDPFLCL